MLLQLEAPLTPEHSLRGSAAEVAAGLQGRILSMATLQVWVFLFCTLLFICV